MPQFTLFLKMKNKITFFDRKPCKEGTFLYISRQGGPIGLATVVKIKGIVFDDYLGVVEWRGRNVERGDFLWSDEIVAEENNKHEN